MKKITMVTLSVLASLALSGCGEEEVKTQEYYMQHEAERTEKVAWCKESADRMVTVNCKNAGEAKAKKTMEMLHEEGIPMDDKEE
jgi:outer membrane lipoprotein SlyB